MIKVWVVCAVVLGFVVMLFVVWYRNSIYSKKKQIEILLNTINDFLYIKDVKSRFIIANDRNARVLNLKSSKKLRGKTDLDFYPEHLARRFYNDELNIIKTGVPMEGIIEPGLNKHGEYIDISTSKYPIRNKKGKVIGIAGIGREVTDIIRYEKKLVALNKQLKSADNAKSELISIIAHDIRNSLNSIKGYSALISQKIDKLPVEKTSKYAKSINNSINNLNILLDNILTWSKVQEEGFNPKPIKLGIGEIIGEVCNLFMDESEYRGVRLNYDSADNSDLYLNADRGMLKIILRNVIGNAIKYTPKDGEVCVNAQKTGDEIQIMVSDTGCGINSGKVTEMMLYFNQLEGNPEKNSDSHGFGLKFCLDFLRLNQGRFSIRSNQPYGTIFSLFFQEATNPKSEK